ASVGLGSAAQPLACNRHSFERHRHVRRGFLPRGLSNTCPLFGAIRTTGMSRGQVSNKPKRELMVAIGVPTAAMCP
ncbi:MAG: hypothetical protein ACT6S0_07830, partial [Roseateles sp.]|uniref:hypothetical protein n=1 Tax=Roseateles sp. TaxID=1971397 RepID=UPI0040371B11